MNSYTKNRRMRGQMFIVTMVFLVGLVFTVHQLLFQYSFIDLSESAQENDFHLFKNTLDAFNQTLQLSNSCTDAQNYLDVLASFLAQQIFRGGYSIDIEDTLLTLNCSNVGTQNPVLKLTIHIIGADTDTRGSFDLSPVKCTDWTNYGECSLIIPQYCNNNGNIVSNCTCGGPGYCSPLTCNSVTGNCE